MELVMAQIGKSDARAMTGWMFVWFLVLVLLAAVPGSGESRERLGRGPGVYYQHTMTSTMVQDLDGAVSVQVRTLRPVAR